MNQIGLTASGSVIVEMTPAEFKALTQLQTPPPKPQPAGKPEASKMTTPEIVAFVKERIVKLKPKKRDGVIHSITAMFQFTGGIPEPEVQKVIAGLQKQRVLTITADGKVAYPTS